MNAPQHPIATAEELCGQISETRRTTSVGLEERLYRVHRVLDHGFVRVIDYMGDDTAICQAARVSYGKGTKTVQSDEGLIRYLMRRWHTTPFEMCEIKLHVKLPIFVARQWIRHRTANVNECSARYSLLSGDTYDPVPEVLAPQSTVNRQGREGGYDQDTAFGLAEAIRRHNFNSIALYEKLANEEYNLSRELARIVLPVSSYTEWYWKIDLHNLFHFLYLRADPHAQREIREYAEALCRIVEDWVPMAWAAFRDYRLNAVSLSAQAADCLRRRLAGKTVTQENSGMGAREWREFLAHFPDPDAAISPD